VDLGLAALLEKLKSMFRRRRPGTDYRSQTDEGPVVVPAGPPTGQIPPVAPVDEPGADAKTGDDDPS
jgi:hypothetical protein